MTTEIECFICRFFARSDTGLPTDPNEVIPDYGVSGEGECRRHPPRHGKTIIRKDKREYECFGNWPRAVGDYWCGEFEPVPNK
jgi:hypothetical protein